MKTSADYAGRRNGEQDSQATSRSLLARARLNDAQAWERLVNLYAPLVFHWCKRWNVPDEDIHDIFQEVFRSVAANLGAFRKQKPGDTFRGWLRVIARNKVCDHYDNLKREPRAVGGTDIQIRLAQVPIPPEPSEDEAADDSAYSALINRAIEQIRIHFTDHTWRAFWRIVVDGQHTKDVADELSMSLGAVRVAKSRVLQRLREELGELID